MRHQLCEVGGRSHAHDVARPLVGEKRRGFGHGGPALLGRLAHRDAADRIAVETAGDDLRGAPRPELGVASALDDAEERPALARMGRATAPRPAPRPLDGREEAGAVGRQGRAIVEGHGDVAAQGPLDLHAALRRHGEEGAVEMRPEDDRVVRDRPPIGQAEHLEAAAVGQDRPLPAHEAVHPAQPADRLLAGPEPEVVGVAEDDLEPETLELLRRHPLHGGGRPDRHEGGGLDRPVRRRDAAASRPRASIADQDAE